MEAVSAAATLRRLADDPAYVRLDGVHCVKHALRFGAEIEVVVAADPDASLTLARRVAPDIAERLAALLVAVAPSDLSRLGRPDGRHPVDDLVAVARRPAAVAPGHGPVVGLEEPRHLGNVGAVIRVAAGFGARAVRTTGPVDPWHPTVVRGAAGLHFAVPVERVDTGQLCDGGGAVLAFDADGTDLRRVAVPDDAVLVFGSERRGLSAELRRHADELVAIPMRAQVSSYNLATSVAMALYHWSLGGAPQAQPATSVADVAIS